jgi:hypothetical protein
MASMVLNHEQEKDFWKPDLVYSLRIGGPADRDRYEGDIVP